jgi:hypothetical protein
MQRSKPKPKAAIAIGAALTAAVGCTLARPLDHLTRGFPPDAGDGAVGATDGGGDAALEAPDAAFCANLPRPAPFFCADFDDTTIQNAYYEGVKRQLPPFDVGGDASAAWSEEGKTHPGSVALATGPVPDGVIWTARLNTPAHSSKPTDHVELTFAVRVASFTSGSLGLVTVVFDHPDGGEVRAFYELGSGDDAITVEGTSGKRLVVPKLPLDEWTRARFSVSLGDTITAQLFFGDDKKGEVTAPARYRTSAGASFLLGIDAVGPAAAMKLLLDDIVFSP